MKMGTNRRIPFKIMSPLTIRYIKKTLKSRRLVPKNSSKCSKAGCGADFEEDFFTVE